MMLSVSTVLGTVLILTSLPVVASAQTASGAANSLSGLQERSVSQPAALNATSPSPPPDRPAGLPTPHTELIISPDRSASPVGVSPVGDDTGGNKVDFLYQLNQTPLPAQPQSSQ